MPGSCTVYCLHHPWVFPYIVSCPHMWGYRVGMDAPSALNVDERHDDGKQFEVMKTQNYTAARHLHKVFCNMLMQLIFIYFTKH